MELLSVLVVCFVCVALILPWVNLVKLMNRKSDLAALRSELRRVHRELETLRNGAVDTRAAAADEASVVDESKKVDDSAGGSGVVVPPSLPPRLPSRFVEAGDLAERSRADSVVRAPVVSGDECDPTGQEDEAADTGFDWFARVAVWVGAVALLMAGFFMIKYSMESGLLTPVVRLWLTTGFGVLLCGGGYWVSLRTRVRANEAVGQALSGAGTVCLYFAVYASVHLYDFVGVRVGFVGMVMVTVMAVLLSLRNGLPIAFMGLLGGFLTPLLMRGDAPSSWLLFGYLFVLLGAAQLLCVRRQWWGMLLVSLGASYVWSVGLLAGYLAESVAEVDGLLIFVGAVCVLSGWLTLQVRDSRVSGDVAQLLRAHRLIAWGLGLLQGLSFVLLRGFGVVDTLLFYVLAGAALWLAVLRERECHWLAWFGLCAVACVAVLQDVGGVWSWLGLPIGVCVLFAVVGYRRGRLEGALSMSWLGLTLVALFAVVPLLFLNRECVAAASAFGWFGWIVLSLGMAALICLFAEWLLRSGRLAVASGYFAAGVLLVCFGLWASVDEVYHAELLGLMLAGVVVCWQWRGLLYLERLGGLLVAVWGVLMATSGWELSAYFFSVDGGVRSYWGVSPVAWLLGALALALFVRARWDEFSAVSRRMWSWGLGVLAVLVFTVLYRYVDAVILGGRYGDLAMEAGLTVSIAVVGLLLRLLGVRWSGVALPGALALSVLVLVRVVVLHLWDEGAVGASVVLNAVLFQFGVPCVVAMGLAYLSVGDEDPRYRMVYQVQAMLLMFFWGSYLVKDFYGAATLMEAPVSSSELYAYSVVWLLLAVGWEWVGLLRGQRALHVGSLLLLLVTVGKVFLVDAAELEGLYRVFSFLGLGVVLIGIGFFYNRFVFGAKGSSVME